MFTDLASGTRYISMLSSPGLSRPTASFLIIYVACCESESDNFRPELRPQPMYPRSLSPSYGCPVGSTLIICGYTFLGLATIAIGIRLWSRKIQRKALILNDYAAMLAWV